MSGTMGGMLLGNQFGYDGSAYAAHLLSRVPGSIELRARAAAVALVALPVQIAGRGGGRDRRRPGRVTCRPGWACLAASFGAAVAAAALLSVLAPYPLPENANPFAMNSGARQREGSALDRRADRHAGLLRADGDRRLPGRVGAGWSWVVLAVGLGVRHRRGLARHLHRRRRDRPPRPRAPRRGHAAR